MKGIQRHIDIENVIIKHKADLDRLLAYSMRELLSPAQITIELAKMQKQALTRCSKYVSDEERSYLIHVLERLNL